MDIKQYPTHSWTRHCFMRSRVPRKELLPLLSASRLSLLNDSPFFDSLTSCLPFSRLSFFCCWLLPLYYFSLFDSLASCLPFCRLALLRSCLALNSFSHSISFLSDALLRSLFSSFHGHENRGKELNK
jgi:hypothetical protein